jgi:hypothetical protein
VKLLDEVPLGAADIEYRTAQPEVGDDPLDDVRVSGERRRVRRVPVVVTLAVAVVVIDVVEP